MKPMGKTSGAYRYVATSAIKIITAKPTKKSVMASYPRMSKRQRPIYTELRDAASGPWSFALVRLSQPRKPPNPGARAATAN